MREKQECPGGPGRSCFSYSICRPIKICFQLVRLLLALRGGAIELQQVLSNRRHTQRNNRKIPPAFQGCRSSPPGGVCLRHIARRLRREEPVLFVSGQAAEGSHAGADHRPGQPCGVGKEQWPDYRLHRDCERALKGAGRLHRQCEWRREADPTVNSGQRGVRHAGGEEDFASCSHWTSRSFTIRHGKVAASNATRVWRFQDSATRPSVASTQCFGNAFKLREHMAPLK